MIKSRLIQFLRFKGMSHSELSRRLGVSPTYVGAMRKSLPEDKVKRLCEIFPDLNRDWLIYGEGDMLKNEEDGKLESDRRGYLVPLLPVEAFAGSLQMWSQSVSLADCEKIVSPVPGADFAIRISGDSMEPDFVNGSVILIKKINDRAFIPWGNPMVIDTENGVLIKALYPSDKSEDYVEARSYNVKYPPIKLPTSSIYGLYRVMTVIRQISTM